MELLFPVLSTIIFLPALGAMLAFLIASEELVKRMALITSALTFADLADPLFHVRFIHSSHAVLRTL